MSSPENSTSHSRRIDSIEPFHVMALLARARELESQGKSIIHMEIGEPDFVSPDPIIAAGIEALKAGKTHYTPAVGHADLRKKIAAYYYDRFSVQIDPNRIVITPGASGALQLILSLLLEPGDCVMMSDPGYPCNRNLVILAGGSPLIIPCGPKTDFQLTQADIANHWGPDCKAAMLSSPANPTGNCISVDGIRQIYDEIKIRKGYLIIDEIYQGLTYGAPSSTALQISDDLFIVNSFSKYFGMTGWRLGWLVAPEKYIADIDKIAQNIFLAASTPAQYAAIAAFDKKTQKILEERRKEFMRRRDYLIPALQALGFTIASVPQGAFYLYADCSQLTDDSFKFSQDLLEKAGVAITPGKDFGHYKADQHVRFAYTTAIENLEEGIKRLAQFLQNN